MLLKITKSQNLAGQHEKKAVKNFKLLNSGPICLDKHLCTLFLKVVYCYNEGKDAKRISFFCKYFCIRFVISCNNFVEGQTISIVNGTGRYT